MSEWTTANFQEAVVNVFERASRDEDYRALCVNDPVAAVKAVSDIDIPPDANIRFFEDEKSFVYCYKLPDLVDLGTRDTEQVKRLIRSTLICTEWPTGAA